MNVESTTAIDTIRVIVMLAALVVLVLIAWTGVKAPSPRKHLHGAAFFFLFGVLLFQPTRLGDTEVSPLLISNGIGVALGLLYLWSFRRSERARDDADC